MNAQQSNAREIFLDAIEQHPPHEWPMLLDAACGDNAALRERVEALLKAHCQSNQLLDGAGLLAPVEPSNGERQRTRIGPYKLVEQIGEGGFGIVFLAEQTEPVRRLVALKVIKPGMDTRQVIARFEAERQALAVMDHPNIARVFDAGTSVVAGEFTGRPYFVMELVRGSPITEYCDQNSLPIRERLELFSLVCQAIQHAHTKGIIHRDIKPTNVLVTRQDHRPQVKVIDFGIAKALGQQLTEKTLFTDFSQMIGTPLYMSPEQAELSRNDIDTRSDIYSLGALLYELLTGSTPVSKEQLKAAAFDEIRRIIREVEPQKPSTRITTADPRIATERHQERAKLTRMVRGELDWIVMKALEKDRNRRYETASGFAADIQRYLADEPVQAGPPSTAYRLRKFARRHKGPVLAGSLIWLALLAGVIGTTWGLIQAARQRQVVERQRDELADRNQSLEAAHQRERLLSERARQAIETIASDQAIDQLTREKQLRPDQRDYLAKMIEYYAESAAGAAATHEDRSRQARAYHRMGRLNQILGQFEDSEAAFKRAVAISVELAAEDPAQPEFRRDLASSHNAMGILLLRMNRSSDAEAAYTKALVLLKQLAADFPARAEYRQALAGIHNNLGNRYYENGRLTEAEDAYVEAMTLRKQLAVDSPTGPNIRRALAMSHNSIGWIFHSTHRPSRAEAAFRDAVDFQKQQVAATPYRPEFRMELAKYLLNLGKVLRDSKQLNEAHAAHTESLAIYRQLVAEFPNRPEFREELADAERRIALTVTDTRGFPEVGRGTGDPGQEDLFNEALTNSDFPKCQE